MTQRVLGPKGSPRRRWTLIVPLTLAIVLGLLFVGGAQAVHADFFELDGNTADGSQTPNLDDWANLYNSGGTAASHFTKCSSTVKVTCFDAFALDADKIGKEGDNSYFTGGGSKDREDMDKWQWVGNDQAPDKNDITNAFASAYRGADGKTRLYFGADRYAVNGDAQLGFWFNQNPVCLAGGTPAGTDPNCPASTPNQDVNAGKFVDPTTGALAKHKTGDILALVNFNNGGSIGLAGVYKWDETTGTASQVLFGTGVDCTLVTDPIDFCTTSNKTDLGTGEPPWSYTGKGSGTTYKTSAFVEGGINLGAITGAGTCFPSFLAETRSSSGPSTGLSLDAQLKDFALHSFQLCGSSMSTTPKDGSGGSIPAGGLSIGTGSVTATDSATVDVTGISTWSGTLKFFICGPIASGTCDPTVGLQIGSTANISDQTLQPILSTAATLTSVGRYCWAGVFTSGTTGVPDAKDNSTGECFTVAPVTPPLDTAAVASPVSFGSAVQDNATLSGTAKQPGTNGPNSTYPSINASNGANAGGKITFTLLKSDCSTNATGTGTNPQDVTVNGNGTYGPVSFTPDAPGTYHWKAQYFPASGDPNNVGSTHNGSCTDTDETVVVQQIPTNIKTKQSWYPNDTATVSASSGNLGANGSVAFSLYGNSTCTGTALYTETKTITGGSASEEVSTSNTSVAITTGYTDAADSVLPATGAYSWKVVYTPNASDTAHTGKQSSCSAEHFTIKYTNDNGPGSNLP